MAHITVLGNGTWGTATAMILRRNGHEVTVWGFDSTEIADINKSYRNERYLPNHELPPGINFVDSLDGLQNSDYFLVVIPTQFIRSAFEKFGDAIPATANIVVLSKGIEISSGKCTLDLMQELRPEATIAGFFGPSHAEEVASGMPATLVSVSDDLDYARRVQKIFMGESIRVYATSDTVGVQLGAALKNVIALAAGIADGMNLGDNAKSALLVRGLREMVRLGDAMGAETSTFAGISGMGDLITTCFSDFGRNRAVGMRIGKGETLDEIIASMDQVAEGVPTTKAAKALAAKHGVEMPITEELYAVLFDGKNPRKALQDLMLRDAKDEV